MLDLFKYYDGKKINNMIPIAGYARYSSENQRGNNSIEAQKFAVQKFCEDNDLVITKWFIDEAQSGRFDDRPEFLNLISYVTSVEHPVGYIITDMHTRYARNSDDSGYWRKTL